MDTGSSVALVVMMTVLSFVGTFTLNVPWMRFVAAGCGLAEIAMLMWLLFRLPPLDLTPS